MLAKQKLPDKLASESSRLMNTTPRLSGGRGFLLLRWITLTLILTVSFLVIHEAPAAGTSQNKLSDGDWVYFPTNDDDKLKVIRSSDSAFTKDPASPDVARSVRKKDYFGRPGQIVTGGTNEMVQVEYKLGTVFESAKTVLAIPSALLLRCPPEQDEVGSGFEGVIRIWNGTESMPLDKQNVFEGKVGDKVTVEVKDFDRWLFVQLDFGRFPEDLNDVPPDLAKYMREAVSARRAKTLFIGLKHINQRLRVEMKELAPEGRKKAWGEVREIIAKDPILTKIAEAIKGGINWDAPDDEQGSLEKEVLKLETQILPLIQWQIGFSNKRFQELTLTLNGIVLKGLRPLNAFNEAETTRSHRPSFRDDTYQWIRFDLERRVVTEGVTAPKPDDVANAAAWSRLLGRPKLHEPMRVTLTVPDAGLELRTKVNPDIKDTPQFQLIGIEANVLYATVVVFAAILVFLAWLARKTDILRDSSGNVRPDGIEPVSLAKTQMAFWFILTAAAFAFLWVTTGDHNTINKTCLVLIGIGATTALSAAFIPSHAARGGGRNYPIAEPLHQSREAIEADIGNAIVDRLRQLNKQTNLSDPELRRRVVSVLRGLVPKDRLAGVLGEFKIAAGEAAAVPESHASVPDELDALVKVLSPATPGSDPNIPLAELAQLSRQKRDFQAMAKTSWGRLFADWLSENPSGDSYDFHRFQMLAWTLLLGLVFIAKLLGDRAMPEFSDTTLILLGISGGTYIGFKIPAALAAKKESEATEPKVETAG